VVEAATTRRAALNEIYQPGDFGEVTNNNPGVTFSERRALSIIQVAAWEDQADATVSAIEQAAGVKPSRTACSAAQSEQTAAIWVGPERWLIVETENRDLDATIRNAVSTEMAAITDQSHSRCVIRLSGDDARNVLRKGTTLDLDVTHFKPGEARTTSIFHMNGLIHCLSEDSFDIYVARSFGQSFFEVITHAAAEYGYRIESPM
jgi:heterotetrameric sarcosine oxidase gamma subunit